MRESVIYQEILQEGERKGELKGRQEAVRTIATNLLRQGMAIDAIATATGLTIAEVETLAKSVN